MSLMKGLCELLSSYTLRKRESVNDDCSVGDTGTGIEPMILAILRRLGEAGRLI